MCEAFSMKLFAKLFLAPAALGLLAPFSVSASEINTNDITSYSSSEEEEEFFFDSTTFNNKLATEVSIPDSPFNGIEAGSFSETTTLSGSASFAIAGGKGDLGLGDEEAITFAYYYDLDLDTSFTGDDNLNVGIEAGNTPATAILGGTGIDFGTSAGDGLKVVDINYVRQFGDLTLGFGDSYKISEQFDGACAYSGFTTHLSDCGTGASAGVGGDVTIAGNYDLGSGFTVGAGLSSLDGSSTKGIFSKESSDLYAIQVAYAADSYGAAITYTNSDTSATDTVYWGLNGYYTFGSFIDSLSVGYETGNPTGTGLDTSNWFAGITTSEVGPGVINLGAGTVAHATESDTKLHLYEVSYGWDINDSISANVGAFVEERETGSDDLTGYVATTTFSF